MTTYSGDEQVGGRAPGAIGTRNGSAAADGEREQPRPASNSSASAASTRAPADARRRDRRVVAQRRELLGVPDVGEQQHRREHERAEHRAGTHARRGTDERAGGQRGEGSAGRGASTRPVRAGDCGRVGGDSCPNVGKPGPDDEPGRTARRRSRSCRAARRPAPTRRPPGRPRCLLAGVTPVNTPSVPSNRSMSSWKSVRATGAAHDGAHRAEEVFVGGGRTDQRARAWRDGRSSESVPSDTTSATPDEAAQRDANAGGSQRASPGIRTPWYP